MTSIPPYVISFVAESTGVELPWRQRRKGSDIVDVHVSIYVSLHVVIMVDLLPQVRCYVGWH